MIAIEAGEDGLSYIVPFMEKLSEFLKADGIAAIEFWHTHGEPVMALAEKHLPTHLTDIRKDLAGYDRYGFFSPQ
jgi:methylase of polypeptide subunit release factors